MKSERLLRVGWVLVAVRATAADFAARPGFPSWFRSNVLGSSGEPRRAAAQDEPEHDRLRPAAGLGRAPGTLPHPARARAQRAIGRRQGALPPLRPDLADVRRGAPGRLPPKSRQGLVGA